LSSGDVTDETTPLKVSFDGHSSLIVYNIIKTLSNPIILGFYWLEKYNPFIDWKLYKVTVSIQFFLIEPIRKFQTIKPLFVGARTFIKTANKVHHSQFMQLKLLNKLLQPQKIKSKISRCI